MMRFALLTALALSACSIGNDAALVRLSDARSEQSTPIRAETVLVRTVSLPAYAASEDVVLQALDGTLAAAPGLAWADQPERAVTLALTRQLGRITGAITGPDPWPLEGLADAVIDIRVQDIFAGAGGVFVVGGQYFVSGDPAKVKNRARSFEITTPFDLSDARSISDAKATALLMLAETIASDLAAKR